MRQIRALAPDDHNVVHVYQTRYMAKLMVLLAEEQEKASEKMEQLTTRLITQTDTLVKFTRGLYWFPRPSLRWLLCSLWSHLLYADSLTTIMLESG